MASQANPYGVTTALRTAKLKINPQLITDFVTLGLGWVRLMVLWSSIELTQGVYDASALDVLDDAVHRCNLAGLNMQFPIQQPPAWHQVAADCDPGSNVHHMADPTSVANFANFLSKRYNGVTNVPNYGPLTIDSFEIGNEEFDVYFCSGFPTTVAGQPCRDPKWFIPCLKAASPVIRANSPNALIGMNAMWWEYSPHHVTFMQALYDNGCKDLFDYANIHLYPSPTAPGTDIDANRLSVGGQINEVYNVMVANNDGNKNVWVTEWGAPTTDMTDAARVTWFNDFLDICRLNGHVGVTNIYTMNYTDPLVNPASQSFSLTQFNAPHYTQTFFGVQAYIAKFPTWGGLPPPPPPPPPKSTIPHVCVVALENHSYTSVLGNANFPHINALLSTYGYATKFYGVGHPSLPNYVGFACGSTHGISNDSYNPATSPLGGNTLVDSMANASPAIPWKHYAENLPSTGYLGGDTGGYVQHHNPWVYFGTVRSSTSQHNNIVNYSNANVGLAHDLTAGTAPPFMFVQPNNTNNGHTGTDTQCDNWVNTFMTLIQASTWYTANDGQIVLWWDESHPDTDTAGIGDANPGGGHVMFIVINAQNSHATFNSNVNHFGLLRALEELYKLPFLNNDGHTINGDPTPLFSQPIPVIGPKTYFANPGDNLQTKASILQPGDTLILNDGTYLCSSSMVGLRITGIHGTASAPITIKAAHDGKAIIDGQNGSAGGREPIFISDSSYVTVQGIVAQNSWASGSVVWVYAGGGGGPVDHVTLQRITAHHAPAGNFHCIEVSFGPTNVLVEDCAAWGPGRYMFSVYHAGAGCILRRCYAYWNTITNSVTQPRACFNPYGTSGLILENCIGIHAYPQSSNTGDVWDSNYYTGVWHDSDDQVNFPLNDTHHLGCIYYNNYEAFHSNEAIGTGLLMKDCYFECPAIGGGLTSQTQGTGVWSGSPHPSTMQNCTIRNSVVGLHQEAGWSTVTVTNTVFDGNTTAIAGTPAHTFCDFFGNTTIGDTVGGTETTADPGYSIATYGRGGALFIPASSPLHGTGSSGADIGANILYQYVNGTLTATPLWPWPMEDRVMAELGQSPTYATGGGPWTTLAGLYGTAFLSALPSALTFNETVGSGAPSPQTITLTNGGASSASYTAASSQSWLSVSPTSHTISAGGTDTSTISVSSGLSTGTYTGKITYTGPSNIVIVTVTLLVAPSGPSGTLVAYLTGTPSSTLSTANLIYTASGGSAVVNNTTQIGTLKGYGELFSQGTTNAWAALGTAPAPSGHGWLLDSSLLEGNDLVGGTYTAALRLKTSGASAISITADIHCRLSKRSSGGVYTPIADCVLLDQIIATSNTTFAPSFTTAGNTSFASGDKLYIDLVLNILTNTGLSTLTITVSDLSLETGSLTGLATAAVVTPGYLATVGGPPPLPGITALSLYGSSAAASAIATAGKLAIATGGTAALQPTQLGIATGYSEIYALGNAGVWAAAGSIGAPSGNGWVLDASEIDLAGQQIVAGNWVPNITLSLSDTGGGVGTGSTALTVYGTSVPTSTLATAGKLATTTGGSGARQSCLLGTATGWGEMYALGNSGAWAAAGSIGAPSGHGWLWDVTTLEAQQIIAGTWRPTVRASLVGAGTIKADISVRAYKRSSGGTYTLIGTFSITGRSITGTTATFTPVAASESLMTFTTGDKLYLDCWENVTANTLGNSSLHFGVELATSGTAGVANAMQMITPGYQATGGGGGSGAITADMIMRAFVYNANAVTYTPIGTFSLTGQSIDGTPSVYSLAPMNLAALNFNANETVYLDLWPNVTDNTLASATLQINASLATGGTAGVANAMQLDTPGYQTQGGGGGGGGSGGGPPITANSCIIGGQPYMTLAGTTQAGKSIGRRSQANVTVLTDTSTFFQQYQTVQIYDNNAVLAFNGYIMQPVTTKPGFQNLLIHTMSCTDQHFLADKRVVAASYSNKTIGAIAQDIYTNILAAEGVSVGQIFDGLIPSLTLYPSTTLYPQGNSEAGLIPQAVFAYCTVAAALDALVKEASVSGVPYYWQIDENYQLWVVPYTAVINPTLIDGTLIDDGQASGVVPSITRANPSYRNTQYIVGGVAQTVQQTNIRVGDGNATAWPMDFDLASTPIVSVNLAGAGYVTKTVGIRGVDTGKDFYWQQGSPDITQDSSGTKLRGPTGTIDLLQVVYIGQYPTVILDANAAQVAYEASIDGSTGIIEEVENDQTLSSVANGLTKASSLLTRYACQGAQFVFATRQSGLAPGQLAPVDYPRLGIFNTQMLIESVSLSDQQDGYTFWYTVTAIQGPYDVTWVDFFSKLLAVSQPANSINVGVGASVPLSASFTGGVTLSAVLKIRVTASPIPSTSLYPSISLYPS